MERTRGLFFYKDHFNRFYEKLELAEKIKVDYVLYLVTVAEMIPSKFFRAITGWDGLYEVRVASRGNAIRIFVCFDNKGVIILLNAFIKKTGRTPRSEIKTAMRLMNEYFSNA